MGVDLYKTIVLLAMSYSNLFNHAEIALYYLSARESRSSEDYR